MRNSWKRQWKKELDERVPALRDDVLNAPISIATTPEKQRENVQEKADEGKKRRLFNGWSFTDALNDWVEKFAANLKSRKRLVLRITATAAACFMVCIVALMTLLPTAPVDSRVGAVALEINPRAVFTMDDGGKVTAVIAGNADADVILSSEKRRREMENKPIAAAMKTFVDYAAKLGYLDLESGDIIRLSMCDGKEDIISLRNILTGYFCEKGLYVAVLAEQVSARTFCERVGEISNDTVEQMVQTFESLPMLYSEREIAEKSVEELQAIYQSTVSPENIKSSVEEVLGGGLELRQAKAAALQAIDDLNEEIKNHEENPAFLFKDYWSVRDFQKEEDISLRFALLLQAMEILIDEYEKTYHEQIESEIDLKALKLEASSEILTKISDLLSDFSMEVFNGSTEFLSKALGFLGIEVDLEELFTQPQSVEEYVEKTNQYNQIRYKALQTDARQSYEEDREALTEEQYAAFEQALCAEYGSLQAYWDVMSSKDKN